MRRALTRRWAAAAVAVVLVAGGGAAYGATNGTSSPHYRTVAATTDDVEQTLSTSGTVDAANRADLGFGTDGTIAALKVAEGDVVKAGQVLAVLETTELDAAVTDAKASLARAVAQLASDRQAQSDAVADAASADDVSSDVPTGTESSTDTGAALRELRKLQDAVIDAQRDASAAIVAAKDALAPQTVACAAALADPTEEEPADEDGETPVVDGTEACATALALVQDRQADVSDAQDGLAKALNDLAGALTKALASASSSTPSAQSTSETEASSGPQSGGQTVTAAQLASDQAQIEQAEADLVGAQQTRAQAKLRSTRAGRVVDLAAGVGDSLAAGDTVATVIGGTAVTIGGSVAEAKVDQVKVGQQVRVTVPGSAETADGVVTAIGLVADTSTGSTSYPVTVTVEDPSIPLPTGSSALLEIVLSTAKDVVTVPTSAVSGQGDAASVQVWDGTKLSAEQVSIGVVGARRAEITDGLQAGDQVVLANIDDPIEGASSEINERGGFGGNGPVMEFRNGGGGGGPQMSRSGP